MRKRIMRLFRQPYYCLEMCMKMEIPREDNFLRAGKIWMKIWTVSGLTCLTVNDSSVYISKAKVLHSVLSVIAFCAMAYFRYAIHDVGSNIQVYTGCSSVICSALIVLLTMVNSKREYASLLYMYGLRKKYLLLSSRSVYNYFPPSCTLPCLSLILENIAFIIMSIKTLKPIALVSYSFSVYSFLFLGQVQFYSKMVEDGFRNLNDRIKILESTASVNRRDSSVKELRGFRLMHHELSTYSKIVDDLFSSRITLTVGHNFALGVLFTFNAVFDFVNPVKEPVYPTEYTSILLSYWALCCFMNLYFLVQPYERVRNEARYTPIAVQSLSTRPGYKKTFYDELKLFSAQLVLDDFEPAPHNFLVLNNRMLMSILGAVGSSLAIFLQMFMTAKN